MFLMYFQTNSESNIPRNAFGSNLTFSLYKCKLRKSKNTANVCYQDESLWGCWAGACNGATLAALAAGAGADGVGGVGVVEGGSAALGAAEAEAAAELEGDITPGAGGGGEVALELGRASGGGYIWASAAIRMRNCSSNGRATSGTCSPRKRRSGGEEISTANRREREKRRRPDLRRPVFRVEIWRRDAVCDGVEQRVVEQLCGELDQAGAAVEPSHERYARKLVQTLKLRSAVLRVMRCQFARQSIDEQKRAVQWVQRTQRVHPVCLTVHSKLTQPTNPPTHRPTDQSTQCCRAQGAQGRAKGRAHGTAHGARRTDPSRRAVSRTVH
jgi:hypothetical protein